LFADIPLICLPSPLHYYPLPGSSALYVTPKIAKPVAAGTSYLEWKAMYNNGHARFDLQHQWLVHLINQIHKALELGKARRIQSIKISCDSLVDYTIIHFTDEENTMKTEAIDMEHQNIHIKEHKEFVDSCLGARKKLLKTECGPEEIMPLLKFLVKWLRIHITGTDADMCRILVKVKEREGSSEQLDSDSEKKESWIVQNWINWYTVRPLVIKTEISMNQFMCNYR